ncbi:DUF2894 domain-containing protein [Xanthomonas sp. AM6]|uniref:DUF2894 domain-containing protein n=1 Tax=Xanthomonas sp. AM6 TaxID=2982531 RepID=UPI0021D9E5DD|nr:DUF2894 domain-containing protein [Xanthomonas sp. AM6]UYB53248.1 DUF2894 domain-containing protein [Xanthomonas sp. AM6]
MRADPTTASARIAAWRAQHGARVDPLRLRFIEALARRADAHQGQARRLLDQKLSALLDAYAADMAGMPAAAVGADGGADTDTNAKHAGATPAAPRGPLGELLELFADAAPNTAASAAPIASAPVPALDDARKLWTELRSRSQLRQSLQQAPSGAGPLNSGVLVHRALALMRTLSPGYLQQFLAYVDTLSWLERMHEDGVLATRQNPSAAIGKKPARGKPRKRS